MKQAFNLSLISPFSERENRYDIYDALYANIEDGMTFTLKETDCAPYDDFLIFNNNKVAQTITIHKNCVPYWLEFNCDEPIRLEECPLSFYRTLLKNIANGNYTNGK